MIMIIMINLLSSQETVKVLEKVKSVVQAWTRLIFVAATVVIDQKMKRDFLEKSIACIGEDLRFKVRLVHLFLRIPVNTSVIQQ